MVCGPKGNTWGMYALYTATTERPSKLYTTSIITRPVCRKKRHHLNTFRDNKDIVLQTPGCYSSEDIPIVFFRIAESKKYGSRWEESAAGGKLSHMEGSLRKKRCKEQKQP